MYRGDDVMARVNKKVNKEEIIRGYKFKNFHQEELVVLYEVDEDVVVAVFVDKPYKQAMLKVNCHDHYIVHNGNKRTVCEWQDYMNEKHKVKN